MMLERGWMERVIIEECSEKEEWKNEGAWGREDGMRGTEGIGRIEW